MTRHASRGVLMRETSLLDYFRCEFSTVLRSHDVRPEPQTQSYLPHLLTYFPPPDRLFAQTTDRVFSPPLTILSPPAPAGTSPGLRISVTCDPYVPTI